MSRNIKKTASVLFVALIGAFTFVAAQDDEAENEAAAEAVEVSEPAPAVAPVKRGMSAELDALEAALDEAFEGLRNAGVAAATPIYVEAKSRIRSAKSIITPKPASKGAKTAFAICSTHVAAALLQLEREANLVRVAQLKQSRDSALVTLHNLHETISRIEGGRAYRLSQELEATRAKSSLLQGDLELAKANLAAERERLRQVMEDAQRRFAELQSELIKVSKDARGTIITMADILFETGKANLTENLRTNLARIAGILMVYKDPSLVVEGHTDNVGTREFNQKLSEDRANNVMKFLVENGVAAERLTAVGSAFDKPIADNSTPEGRAQNRRVDLIIQDAQLDAEFKAEDEAAAKAADALEEKAAAEAVVEEVNPAEPKPVDGKKAAE